MVHFTAVGLMLCEKLLCVATSQDTGTEVAEESL